MRKLTWAFLVFVLASNPSLVFPQPLFAPPVKLSSNINTDSFSEEDPFITADGQKLFFVSNRAGSLDIWYSNWDSVQNDWGVPVRLPAPINTVNDDYSPSVSPDGKKLYWLSFGGGMGGWDVWYSNWDSINQKWGPPVNMGAPVNYIYNEWTPKISYDGRKLYYATEGRGHPQGQAIYTATFDDSLGWQPPVPFPDWINNSGTEEGPYVTPDGKDLYFARWYGIPSGRRIYWSQWRDTNWSVPVVLDSNINNYTAWSPFIGPDSRLFYTGVEGLSVDIWVAERIPTDVNEPKNSNVPPDFELLQNYPNPFNSATTIRFKLNHRQETVAVAIYNITGKLIRKFSLSNLKAGEHQISWEGGDETGRKVASGIYLYVLEIDGQKLVKKMIFLK